MYFSGGDQVENVIILLVSDQSSSTIVVLLRGERAVSPNLNDFVFSHRETGLDRLKLYTRS